MILCNILNYITMKKLLFLLALTLLVTGVDAQTRKSRKPAARQQTVEQRVIGRHMLSLQWISWDYFGYCDIKKQADGTLTCKGEQRSKENDDYLTIDGTIEIVDALHLKFTGTIVTKIYHIANGQPCVREGTFDFQSYEGRRYWRLMQKTNPCDECTDYVDIYFKR